VAAATYSGVETAARILNTTSGELLKDHENQKIRIYNAEDESTWPAWVSKKIDDRKRRFMETNSPTHEKINHLLTQ
jgi:hypothetical protein